MSAPIINAAETYADRGLSVLPVRNNKKPCGKSWGSAQLAAAKSQDVAKWFNRQQGLAGVAVVLGPVSGDLYVRDFDAPDSYDRWAHAHPDLASSLPTVKTPRRGFHVYARWKGVRTKVLDDGELRGQGAYVLAPPSVTPDGSYLWTIPLPADEVAEVDPDAAGLARSWASGSGATERAERTERTEPTEPPETTEVGEDTEDDDAIRRGWCEKTRKAIDSATARTQPPAAGKRNVHLFRFARALKAIPALADIPKRRVRVLRPVVKEWHRRALAHVLTKDFGTTWGDFVYAWGRVRFAEGADVLGQALAAAEQADPPVFAADYSPPCKLLASLCRELQRRAGDQPFFLSCRKAGEAVGADQGTACRWLCAFVADGAIKEESKGSRETGRASRFRYLGD